MGVHCQILIKKPREGVHRAGKPVNGLIKYAVDEPTEYRNIMLSLIGSGKCSWTENHGKSSTTYIGTEDYITQHISLLNQPGEPVTIPVGSYEYPFQFILPENIPPSIKTRTCTISYLLKLKFEKASFFTINRVFQTELIVYCYVNPITFEGPVIFGLEKAIFKLFSENPKFNIKAEIDKSLFNPGENAKLSLIINNDTDITDWSIITALQSHIVYTSNCGRTKVRSVTLKESSTEFVGSSDIVTTMSRIVPILPNLYSVQNSKIMDRTYNVVVTLRLPLPHFNAIVAMPVVVGERKGVEEQIEDMPEDEPPSYWESVCEQK